MAIATSETRADPADYLPGQEPVKDKPVKDKPKKEEKTTHAPTEYVVLIDTTAGADEGWQVVADDNGDPRTFPAYRQIQVFDELVDAGLLNADKDGKSEWVAIVPARSWKPRRATIGSKTTVTIDIDPDTD